jgi:hypothetical protein
MRQKRKTTCPQNCRFGRMMEMGVKTMAAKLFIAFEPHGGEPVTLAVVNDRGVLVKAARKAIAESRGLATLMRREDSVLGRLQLAETQRLANALGTVIPELGTRK